LTELRAEHERAEQERTAAHTAEVARLMEDCRLAQERASATEASEHERVARLEQRLQEQAARYRELEALAEGQAHEAAGLTARLVELRAAHEHAERELTARADEIASLMAELNEQALDDETVAESAQRQVVEDELNGETGGADGENLGDVLREELTTTMARIFQQAASSLGKRSGGDPQQQAENLREVAHVAASMAGLLDNRRV
jgi:DNA repair exonuclease SbcCD ATPase subunit